MSTILVTGGAGFIGANFVCYWRKMHAADSIVVLDSLTYAGNPANLEAFANDDSVVFVKGDICQPELLRRLFGAHDFTTVVHFAAESHVDRSIVASDRFIQTNVMGTHALLQAALAAWEDRFEGRRFHHVSTDEVYGSLGPNDPPFTETSPYAPRSPYSASKAGSDHLVRSWFATYGLPITISNCSNNFGPFQMPEKLIPLMLVNALEGRPLPIYGDGRHIRDWLFVTEHCAAIDAILQRGRPGETYNIGGENELANIDLVAKLCDIVDARFRRDPELQKRYPNSPAAHGRGCGDLIEYVKDRPGHDRRYAIDMKKLKEEVGFRLEHGLQAGLEEAVDWYIAREDWWRPLQRGVLRDWNSNHYGWNA